MTTELPFQAVRSMLWLEEGACIGHDLNDYFVEAGKAITQEALNRCRGCPVRLQCIAHAYDHQINNGYFGGLSPSQRRSMTLEEALAFAAGDSA